MRKTQIVTLVAIAVLGIIFLTPFIPFKSSAYQVGGGTYNRWSADVSPSYYAFNCGTASGVNLTTFMVGNGSWNSVKVFTLPLFLCQSQPT